MENKFKDDFWDEQDLDFELSDMKNADKLIDSFVKIAGIVIFIASVGIGLFIIFYL